MKSASIPTQLVLPAKLNTYFTPRCGLSQTGRKLIAGQDVTVVFFGGSITWGGNATDIDQTSYRALTTQWLKQQYPQSHITSINAGIGGTGSDLGVFRCNTDVLTHQPDLVFVEFAVNDGGMDDEQSMKTFEAILRQLRTCESRPDICIVYTIAKDHLELWHQGELSPRAATQEKLAAHYNLPSVRMAKAIADQVCMQKQTWEQVMNDNVHPLDDGHALYASVLIAAMQNMFDAQVNIFTLPSVMTSDQYQNAHMQALPKQADGWQWIDLEYKGGWECFNGLLMAEKPGTTLSLTFNGPLIGLYYQLGPETGNLHYQIDDGSEQLLEPFDKYAVDCTRPQYRILSDELEDAPHTLKLRVADTKDEHAKGTWARLAYLMVGA